MTRYTLSMLRRHLVPLDGAALDEATRALGDLLEPSPPEEAPRERRIDASLSEKDVWYAVHDGDLELLKESATVAAAAIALFKNPVGVVGGLVALLLRYRRERVRLDERQALVLLELSRAGEAGLTADDLAARVDVARFGRAGIEAALASLRSLPSAKGKLTELVTLHDGRWRANDV